MVSERAELGIEFQFGSEDNPDAPAEPEKTKHNLHIISSYINPPLNHLIPEQMSFI